MTNNLQKLMHALDLSWDQLQIIARGPEFSNDRDTARARLELLVELANCLNKLPQDLRVQLLHGECGGPGWIEKLCRVYQFLNEAFETAFNYADGWWAISHLFHGDMRAFCKHVGMGV